MNARIELFVNLTGSTAQGQVDLFGDEPIVLKMAAADIRDIKSRKSSYSQSFVVPGTKNNNILFNSIYNIGIDSQFDARKKTPAFLQVDSIPVMTGNLQLTGINVDDEKNVTYEVSLFDDTGNFIDALGATELTDYKWNELDHTWSYSSITNSWTGSSQPYFYPLIDLGYDWSVSSLNSGQGVSFQYPMYPATQVKTIIDKIFSSTGYTYTSNFFNSDYFKNLYIPFVGLKELANTTTFATSRQFLIHSTTGYTVSSGITYSNIGGIVQNTTIVTSENRLFFNNVTPPNFNNSGLFNITTSDYTADTGLEVQFFINVGFSADTSSGLTLLGSALPGDISNYSNLIVNFYRDGGTGTPVLACPPVYVGIPTSQNTGYTGNLFCQSTPLTAVPNEKFWATYKVYFVLQNPNSGTTHTFNFGFIPTNTYEYNNVSQRIVPFQMVDYGSWIPKKIKVLDFLTSIITMHNLYVVPDPNNPKSLIIEPRDDWYSSGKTLDWSTKWDASVPVTQQLLSEQTNKRIVFSYAEDTDFYSDNYKKATNRIFGDYYQVVDNDFAVQDDYNIDTIFAPTPSVAVLESGSFVPPDLTGFTANEFVIPKIGKTDSNNHFGSTNYKIRILQKNPNNLIPLTNGDSWMLNYTKYTSYPYLGMLSHPSVMSAATDISFGQVNYEFYTLPAITNNNLVNKYWQKYLNQIMDKDAKIVTCNLYLKPNDIATLSLNDTIFMDGLTSDGGHYYLINSIEYTPTANVTSKVELIKLNEKFVSTSGSSPISNVFGQIPLQSINMAGGQSYSTGSIAMGNNVVISTQAAGSVAIGDTISVGSPRSLVVGSGSTIGGGAAGSVIFGNGILATTGNTVYMNNAVISSGGTINGVSAAQIVANSSIWSAGTGTYSIVAINDTNNVASSNYDYAEGATTTARGGASHAEGNITTAFGQTSHAEGDHTTAIGIVSHSEGGYTTAQGDYSHAGGYGINVLHFGEWGRSSDMTQKGAYGITHYSTQTTTNTPSEAFLDGFGGSQRFTIPNNSAYKVKVYAVAIEITTGYPSKEWEGSGLIKNNAGAVSLVGSLTMSSTNGDAALSTTSIAMTAASGALVATVTGISGTAVRWSIKCEYTSVS